MIGFCGRRSEDPEVELICFVLELGSELLFPSAQPDRHFKPMRHHRHCSVEEHGEDCRRNRFYHSA